MLKKIAIIMAMTAILAPKVVADEFSPDRSGVDKSSADESSADKSDQPSWIMDTSGVGRDSNGSIRSDQILELGEAPPNGLQLEGENLMRTGDLDAALGLLQKSVELSPMDIDKRILYAQALGKKLMKSKKRDPALYNFLVKQWLFVYKKSEFPDQTMQARNELAHLSGTIPRPFEKEKAYLSRVLIPEDGTEKLAVTKKVAAE